MDIYINVPELHKLVRDAMNNPLYNEIYNMAKNMYILDLENENPAHIYQTAIRINQRQQEKKECYIKNKQRDGSACEYWAFGQLKIFSWVSIYYCSSKSIQLSKMCETDFTYVNNIFINKQLMFIKFQTYCLAYSKYKIKDEWGNQEKNALHDIIRRMQPSINWKNISFQLFRLTEGKFFRSLQQCRQKWSNYLNPCVKKGDWTLEEDYKLFSLIQIYSHRWAAISRQFHRIRTEHMVKNRYNFYLRNWRKKDMKKTPTELTEKKILNYLKKRDEKRQQKQSVNQRSILYKNEESISQYQNESMSQYNTPLLRESSVGIQQDSISHYNSMMERVEVYKVEKEEKRTREDENDDLQIKLKSDGIDYEYFSQSCDDRIKRETCVLIEEDLLYILPSEIPKGRELFQTQEVNELVSALGCSHYEEIADEDWVMNDFEKMDNLEWLQ